MADMKMKAPPVGAINQTEVLLNAENIRCSSCGCTVFTPGVVFKRVSALTSPSGREETVPIDVMLCQACGKPLNLFKSEDHYNRIIGENIVKLNK